MRSYLANSIKLGVLIVFYSAQHAFAADKNGVSPNAISLPKGPGSIEGLGESFQPHLNTGTAKYGIGLKLATGVAGHNPSLSLNYEGGGANGPLGYGWMLPVQSIQRRTDRGIPTYGADGNISRADSFINESREELVPQSNGYYFSKNEGAFIRYKQVGEHWEGTAPNGTRMEFGISTSARIYDAGHVFSWLLERESDTHGNVIIYQYRSYPGPNDLNQKYLTGIQYGPGAPPWTNYHFVRLEYEDRPDWFEDCRSGFIIRTGKRLKSIVIGTQGPTLENHLKGDFDSDGTFDYLNRKYELEYLTNSSPEAHWSLLGKVIPVGADGVSRLPASTFGYSVSNPPAEASAENRMIGAANEPLFVMDNSLAEFLDINGDALPDILKTDFNGGMHQAFINRGETKLNGESVIQWAPPAEMDAGGGTAWNYNLDSASTHLADMDGDGMSDLVHKSAAGEVFFFSNRGRSAWGPRQEMAAEESVPPAPFGQPGVRTADLDFDKRIDIVQSVAAGESFAYRIWFNMGSQSYSRPVTVEQDIGFSFEDPAVQIADGNGDRVPDIVRVRPENILMFAGLGYGRFASPITVALPNETLSDSQVDRARMTDMNGDGLADLVIERAAPGECWYWINLGNYSLSSRKVITHLPQTFSQNAVIRWADINGNGTTDLVFADREATPRIQAVDLGEVLGAGIPNILTAITNGLGRVTLIGYESSTRFALQDAAAGAPWTNRMPLAVSVISAITNLDSLGHEYVSQFRYHDGYYDPVEKQFRGFAHVEQIDKGDTNAPTLVTRSYFDTGQMFEAMKGKVLRVSLELEDGTLFNEAVTDYAIPPRTLMTGTNAVQVSYAHPLAQVNKIVELGQGTPRTLETEFRYDDFGNLTRQADYGIVAGADRSASNDERITTTEYAINTNVWILRLPARNEITDENGVVLSRVESFYDDESFAGTNFKEVTIGNLTLTRAWTNASVASGYIKGSRAKYDAYGNAIALLDPLALAANGAVNFSNGHVREVVYDDRFRSYPVSEIVHVGGGSEPLTVSATYDEGFATVRTATDFNGNITRCSYDTFARLNSIVKPYDTVEFPSVEYNYALAVPAANGGLVSYIETRQLDKTPGSAGSNKYDHYLISRAFSDGLGRSLMTRQEAESASADGGPRVVVTGATFFNARQKPSRTLNPFFSLKTAATLDEMLAYENIEAPGWKGLFHENGALTELALADAHQTTVQYDATLRATKTINADGTFSRVVFEPLITRTYDENDNDPTGLFNNTPIVLHRDGLGRLVRTDEITRLNNEGRPGDTLNTWSSSYEYDLNDCVTRITDSQGNVKTLVFDGLKRRTLMNDPNAGTIQNFFDDAGNLVVRIDAKGQRIDFAYDGANRILSEDYRDEVPNEFSYGRTPDVKFYYDKPTEFLDQGDGTRSTAANTKGLLTWVEDTSGEEHLSYDARGRIAYTIKRVPDPHLDPGLTLQASTLVAYKTVTEYDSFDRMTRMIYPDNDEVTYKYNARGLLERIIGGPGGSILSNIVYTPAGQQAELEYGNGVRTTHAYDNRQRVANLQTLSPPRQSDGTRSSLINFAYQFDGVSNVKQIEDRRPLIEIPAGDKRRNSQTFSYDDLYRLTRVQYNLPNPSAENGGEINYRYDRIGNMLEQASTIEQTERNLPITNIGLMESGGTGGRFNRIGRKPNDPPGPHALTSIRKTNADARYYDYDANGNLKQMDGLVCTWDFRDRLAVLEDDKMRAEYRYDFRGRRVIKRVTTKNGATPLKAQGQSGKTVRSATDYPGTHFEVRENDQPTKLVFDGANRIAQVTGSLSPATRIQRLSLKAGWNLIAVAVNASNFLAQVQSQASQAVVHRWDPLFASYFPVSPGESVAQDTVLWVRSGSDSVASIKGTYADPGARVIPAGQFYLAGGRLEKFSLPDVIPRVSSVWRFDSTTSGWSVKLDGEIAAASDLPMVLGPGSAFFITATNSTTLSGPDPALRVKYYHQDHLGSAGAITDATGALLEETAYYPFGSTRHEHRIAAEEVPYSFTQKERDRESDLYYFEARFLASTASRFISCDPKYLNVDQIPIGDLTAFLSLPAKANVYAYALNNPLRYVDPDGLDDLDKVSNGIDVVGLGNSFLEATDTLENNPAVKVAGKAVTVLSIGIKTAKFIDNPNADTGGQLAYEGTKTLISMSVPPVGVLLAVLDLAGVGPSAALADIEKSIQYNRQATKHYEAATQNYRKAESIYRQGAQKVEATLKELRPKVDRLEQTSRQVVAKIQENQRQTQAEIKRLERDIRRMKKVERAYLERARKASESPD